MTIYAIVLSFAFVTVGMLHMTANEKIFIKPQIPPYIPTPLQEPIFIIRHPPIIADPPPGTTDFSGWPLIQEGWYECSFCGLRFDNENAAYEHIVHCNTSEYMIYGGEY